MSDTSTLTDDQQKGADAFFSFLMSDEKFFVISGSAGVGKTYLMSHLCKRVMQDYEDACKLLGQPMIYQDLVFTATTNKAAEVLENSLGMDVQTIHSYLGLRVFDDYQTGKTKLSKTNKWKIRHKRVVFIDEYSMIDKKMLEIIDESFENSKIIFVGDHAQMAPVNEKTSAVDGAVDPANFVVLTQPVRNADAPPLVDLCKQLRNTVETGVFHPISPVPGFVEYLDDEQMQEKLEEHFIDMDPSARVLCYTNSRVQFFNEGIREQIRGMDPEYGVGDILVVAQTAMSGDRTLNVEREVQIVSLSEIEEDTRCQDIFTDEQPILYRTARVQCLSGAQEFFNVRLALEMERVNLAKQYYKNQKAWADFFDLKNSYADLRDKAACTVYKSQGSTYDTVFVDIGNIGTSFDPAQVARMLFVAISRAKSKVYLYGQLPNKYHGAIAA